MVFLVGPRSAAHDVALLDLLDQKEKVRLWSRDNKGAAAGV
jgi:hypothetical protein